MTLSSMGVFCTQGTAKRRGCGDINRKREITTIADDANAFAVTNCCVLALLRRRAINNEFCFFRENR